MNIMTMMRERQDLIKGQAWEGSSDDLSLITCLSGNCHVWENMWAEAVWCGELLRTWQMVANRYRDLS